MRATRIRRILFSQNPPVDFESSPYSDFVKKYNVKISFYKLFQMEGIPSKDFLRQNISILDHTAIILTSKNATDHFFRIVNELKIKIPITIRYFCANVAIANYLQKYPADQKKVFFSEDGSTEKLVEKIVKYSSDIFLLPMVKDSSINQLAGFLDENEINYTKAEVFKISFADVSKDIDIYSYNMVVFFSPYGVQNLMQSYPDFKQGNIIIAAFGTHVVEAAQKAGLNVQIIAPTPKDTSIFSAIDKFLQKTNTRDRSIRNK